MDILLSNEWLVTTGGTGTFIYTLAGELKRRNHNVYLFTNEWGGLADRICNDFDVLPFDKDKKYDLILANHHTTIKKIYKLGLTIQTCHGIYPYFEQPSQYAHGYVSISQEVQNHLLKKGYSSTIIFNGIDCDRFKPITPLRRIQPTVLSLCHSREAHEIVEEASSLLDMNFKKLDKVKDWKWEVEDYINECDIVVGLGRSAYEGLACGRPLIIFDKRSYSDFYGDGYFLNKITKAVKHNCSGRASNMKMGVDELKVELEKYKPEHGVLAREIAIDNFNIKHTVTQYLNYKTILEEKYIYNNTISKIKRIIYPILFKYKDSTPSFIKEIGKKILKEKHTLHEYYK